MTISLLRQNATRLLALSIMLILYGYARLPELDLQQRTELAEGFDFTQLPLSEPKDYPKQFIRAVNPNLERISGWISAVGASVALNDLDGDGLPNDVCHVDTRIDQVLVAPVPGTGDRYQPMVISPEPLAYDAATMAPMGCLPGDLNEDGRMDLIVYYWGRTPIAFLRTDSDYRPQEIVSQQKRWFTNAATLTDLDGDGHTDLIIANYFQNGARILDANASEPDEMQHSMSRAYNAGETHFFLWTSAGKQEFPSIQYREITDVLAPIVNTAWTLAVGAADLDGDLLPELYFANDFGPDRLLHNLSTPGKLKFSILEGEKTFTTPSSKVLGQDSFKGMGVDFADLNGDGYLDMFVSNIAAEYALEESHFVFISNGRIDGMKQGIAPYQDRSEPLGLSRSDWSWDTKLGDFNNDGVLEALQATGFVKGEIGRWPELQELAIGNDENMRHPGAWPRFQPGDDLSGYTPNPFYVRDGKGRYHDLAAQLGLDQVYVTRGIAVADIDGDGDQDFAIANQWEPSYFYRNDCPRCGSFLGLHLRFAVTPNNRSELAEYFGHPLGLSYPAIGANAKVSLPDGRILVAQVDGGNGHSGRRSPDLHFGLGDWDPDTPVTVDLRWRDSSGTIHTKRLKLIPGWHTVELGNSTSG